MALSGNPTCRVPPVDYPVSQNPPYTRVLNSETTSVSQFAPNPFGLYDMHGNVAEYVEDPYHSSYFGAPTDGSAWLIGGDESRRMLRGGSYTDNATSTRSADRSMNWLPPDTNGSFYTGLRIVREP